jgi:methylase of polypeptide subunit release factors
MNTLVKREATSVASLSSIPALIAREREALARASDPSVAANVERRAAAIVELAKRADASAPILNEATLLRVEALEQMADLVDEGQKIGEIAKDVNGRPAKGSGVRTLSAFGLTKQRLAEGRRLRDAHAAQWFRDQIAHAPESAISISHAIRRAERVARNRGAAARRQQAVAAARQWSSRASRSDRWNVTEADIYTWRPTAVDAIITDPPYIPDDAIDLYRALGRFAIDVLPPGGICAAMVSTDLLAPALRALEDEGLSFFWQIVWQFDNGRDFTPVHSHRVYDRYKPVLVLTNGEPREDREWFHDLIRVRDKEKDLHDWQQTLNGVRELVLRLTSAGMLVCDPFAGSATTGVACLQTDRRFIGGDIDPEAVAVADGRLAYSAPALVSP